MKLAAVTTRAVPVPGFDTWKGQSRGQGWLSPFSDKTTRRNGFHLDQYDHHTNASLTNEWRMSVFSLQIWLWGETHKAVALGSYTSWNYFRFSQNWRIAAHAYKSNSVQVAEKMSHLWKGVLLSSTASWRMRLRKNEAGWAERSFFLLYTITAPPPPAPSPPWGHHP